MINSQAHQMCAECRISLAAAARSDARPLAMMSHSPKRRQAMRAFREAARAGGGQSKALPPCGQSEPNSQLFQRIVGELDEQELSHQGTDDVVNPNNDAFCSRRGSGRLRGRSGEPPHDETPSNRLETQKSLASQQKGLPRPHETAKLGNRFPPGGHRRPDNHRSKGL